MKTLQYYERYTVRTTKILQEYFELPELPIQIDNKYFNCSFIWDKEFIFDVNYLIGFFYDEEKRKKEEKICKSKLLNIEALILSIILHEIGHHYYREKLGKQKYEKIHYSDIEKDDYINRKVEKLADSFDTEHYQEAKYFLKECLK